MFDHLSTYWMKGLIIYLLFQEILYHRSSYDSPFLLIFLLQNHRLCIKRSTESIVYMICGALSDLVPFVQFKKYENHPWRSINFTKINTPPWVFFTFFELYKWCQIAQRIKYNRKHYKPISNHFPISIPFGDTKKKCKNKNLR